MSNATATRKPSIQAIARRWLTIRPCACGATTSAFGSVHDAYANRNGLTIARSGDFSVACKGCGILRTVKPVRGIVNAEHKCDARCTHAKGHNCECECGGKNHGSMA